MMNRKKSEEQKERLIDLLEILSAIIALAAVIVFVFYLFFSYNRCIVFVEPIAYIMAAEIIMGIISIVVLSNLIRKKIIKIYGLA